MVDVQGSILLSSHDAPLRERLGAALGVQGYTVRLAPSVAQALAMYRQQPADLVILDGASLAPDACSIYGRLREVAGPWLPIVFMATADDLVTVEQALKYGANDFFVSSISTDLIRHRIDCLFRHHHALLAQRAAEARQTAVLDAVPDPMFEVDIDGLVIDFRAPKENTLTVGREAYVGKYLHEILDADAVSICMASLVEAGKAGIAKRREFELRRPLFTRWYELSVARKPIESNQKLQFVALTRDITARKEAEARIARLAYFDSLTGLPNRVSFLEQVSQEIARATQCGNRLAVLFMDLDGFKHVNDTLGHAAGDMVLQRVAKRLRKCLRPHDLLARTDPSDAKVGVDVSARMVGVNAALARLGGDEFTAMILNLDDPQSSVTVGTRVLQAMRLPFRLQGRDLMLTASIGIAIYPDHGIDGATLLRRADAAMYSAKSSGRNTVLLFSAALDIEGKNELAMDSIVQAPQNVTQRRGTQRRAPTTAKSPP